MVEPTFCMPHAYEHVRHHLACMCACYASPTEVWAYNGGMHLKQCTGTRPCTCFFSSLKTGTEKNMIRIWEVKQQKCVASFAEHTKPIHALSFSENGYHLASAADDGVKLWDLRKLKVLKWVCLPGLLKCFNQ